MWNRLAWLMLLAVVACKAKEDPAAPPAQAAPAADSAAARVAAAFAEAAAALAQAQASAAAPVAPSAASAGGLPSASPALGDAGFSAALSNELGRLGFSTAAADLTALGKDRGLLLGGLSRLAGHASALSAIFSNDRVVGAFMKRADMQDACRDPEKLKPLLLYVLSSPAARPWVNDAASIKAFTGSKLGVQLQACSSFKALAQESKTLATLTRGQFAAIAIVNHPNFRAELDRLKIRQDVSGSRLSARPRP